ncbi:retinin [Ceratitis capitata]|uniref:(Mediterranean fruit fly) hypothetical protein n=1 Tax=Ceratitis capitata TaxID=7213 RepID=A0A811V7W0_CERCA|nr:retinin [Ceratitis capitata]CAD7006545.1 unnamed protein product [Ceratitis capitata]
MFRLLTIVIAVVLSAALTQARPSLKYLPTVAEHVEYTPTVVGHTVHSLPTAVSHQSQTIVHEKRPYLRPIVEHTPIIKTYTPIVKTYSPVIKTYAPSTSVAWPAVSYGSVYPSAYAGLYDGWSSPAVKSVYGGWSSGWKPSTAYEDWDAWALKK